MVHASSEAVASGAASGEAVAGGPISGEGGVTSGEGGTTSCEAVACDATSGGDVALAGP